MCIRDRDWLDDARRYLTNIVGKYGPHIQLLLKMCIRDSKKHMHESSARDKYLAIMKPYLLMWHSRLPRTTCPAQALSLIHI